MMVKYWFKKQYDHRFTNCLKLLPFLLILLTIIDVGQCQEQQDVRVCNLNDPTECTDGQICAKISSNSKAAQYIQNVNEQGICVLPPASGVLLPDTNPVPIAYFPLSGDSLSSWPYADYLGVSNGVQIVPDELFIYAQECKQDENDFLLFDSVPYAKNGTFAINIWIRTANMSGPVFQYVYAHTQSPPAADNQRIQIYLAEQDHGLYGIIRTLILDSTDPPVGGVGYLDSDNQVYNLYYRNITDKTIVNGEWHMVTVTTHKDFSPGYSMYIDGVLVADYSIDNPGQINEVFGGDPLDLNDRIFLCGRYDYNADYHFDGRVSQLSLYDTPLTVDQIQELYKMVFPDVVFAPEQELHIGLPASTLPVNLDRSQQRHAVLFEYNVHVRSIRIKGHAALFDGRRQDQDKKWVLCSEKPPLPPPNPECVFPFIYRGNFYFECVPFAGVMRCQNAAQEFIVCYPENVEAEMPISEPGSP